MSFCTCSCSDGSGGEAAEDAMLPCGDMERREMLELLEGVMEEEVDPDGVGLGGLDEARTGRVCLCWRKNSVDVSAGC